MANQIPLIVNAGAGQIQQLATEDNLSVTANVVTGNILAGGYFYANGQPFSGGGNATPGGSNTQVQFNLDGAFAGDSSFTYDSANAANGLILQSSFVANPGASILEVHGLSAYMGEVAGGGIEVNAATHTTTISTPATNITGDVSAAGNITGNFIIGDGSQLTNLPSSTPTNIQYGTTTVAIDAPSGNVYIQVDDNPIWTFNSDATLTAPGTIIAQELNAGDYTYGTSGDAFFHSNISGTSIGVTGGGGIAVDGGGISIGGTGGANIFGIANANIIIGGPYTQSVNVLTPINATNSITATNFYGTDISASGNITSDGKVITVASNLSDGAVSGAGLIAGANTATILYDNSVFGWTVNQGWHPAANATYNLGRPTRYWNNLYSVNVTADNMDIVDGLASNSITSGSFLLANAGNSTTSIIQQNQNPPLGSEAFGIELLTTANDNPGVYSSVSAGPDYVSLQSSNAGNANVTLQGGYGITLNTSNATGGGQQTWTFTEGGQFLAAGDVSTTGNVLAQGVVSATGNIITDGYFVGNFAGNITGNIVVPGSNTQVLFNTNGNVDAVGGLTYNKDSNTLTILGVVSAQGDVFGATINGNGANLTSLYSTVDVIALGRNAGGGSYANSISIGVGSGDQGANSVAVGPYSGANAQGSYSVAIGRSAAYSAQGNIAIAIGRGAGWGNQSDEAISIGYGAGNSTQGYQAISIGSNAGANSQTDNAISIGSAAGFETQGEFSIGIGHIAGGYFQGPQAIAIGLSAGNTTQGANAIALGWIAGNINQGSDGIAIGTNAGNNNQGNGAVAIGRWAGNGNQGINSVALGRNAGNVSQGIEAVAVGHSAGNTTQGNAAVAVGWQAGYISQADYSVAIGAYAGNLNMGANAVAIGSFAGYPNSANNSIAINGNPTPLDAPNAGFYVAPVRNDTGNVTNVVYYNTLTNEVTYGPTTIGSSIVNGNSNVSISTAGGNIDLNVNGNPFGSLGFGVALGYNAGGSGNTAFQESGIAIGTSAGNTSQGIHSIAIGWNTGEYLQGNSAVAIGENAGYAQQGDFAIAIGAVAGRALQGANAIAFGTRAGLEGQGAYAIAIGAEAASNNQPVNSIAIVASGVDPVPTNSGLYIDPVRNDTGNVTNAVYYNTTTKEVTYGPAGGGSSVAEAAFTIQSSDFNAVVGNRYGVDTTSNPVTATLTAFPITGTAVFFADAGGAFATNNLTINPVGRTIMGSSGNYVVNTNNNSFGLFWNGTTWRTYSNV